MTYFIELQHVISPEVGIHGVPIDNFSKTGSGGVNLCRFSAGLDLDEPGTSNWTTKTSIKFEVFINYNPLIVSMIEKIKSK